MAEVLPDQILIASVNKLFLFDPSILGVRYYCMVVLSEKQKHPLMFADDFDCKIILTIFTKKLFDKAFDQNTKNVVLN